MESASIMIAVAIVAVLLVVYYWYKHHGAAAAGCQTDTDCAATQVCDTGSCRDIVPPAKNNAEVYSLDMNRYGITSADQAAAIAADHGGVIATQEQVEAAYAAGAQWCAQGWTRAGHGASGYIFAYPIQSASAICGAAGVNKYPVTGGAAVNVFGVKPAAGTLPDCATNGGKGGLCIWNAATPVPGQAAPAPRYSFMQ